MTISKGAVALAIGLVATIAFADVALARTVTKFPGTRDQVRAACANVGGDLIEGSNFTMCENSQNDTVVECTDAGQCTGGSNPTRLGESSPLAIPPASLSESSDDAAAGAPAGGSSGPDAGPVLGGDTSGGFGGGIFSSGGQTGHIN